MQSKTSYFNPTLFRKNLARFWPLWGGASLIAALAPLVLLLNLLHTGFRGHGMQALEMTSLYYYVVSWGVPFISLFYAALCALAVWHFLYSARSVSLYHALPITRKGLFVTNFLSGMAMMLIPYAVAGGLSILISILAGLFEPVGVLMTILYVIGESFFYFATATVIVFFTGNPFAFAAFYFIFHFFAVLAETLVSFLMSMFYFGVSQGYEGVTAFLSPTVYLIENLNVYTTSAEEVTAEGWIDYGVLESVTLERGWVIGVYALAGVVLLGCAWALYRRRRSESAGDVVAVGWMKPVFRYGVALCSALALGSLLYSLLWDSLQNRQTASVLPMAVCMAVMGVIGYYVASMLLAKSIHIFQGSGKGALAVAIVSAAICCVIAADPAGVESWVPDVSGVEQVNVSFYGDNGSCSANVSDSAEIQKILDVHQAVISEKTLLNHRGNSDVPSRRVQMTFGYYGTDGIYRFRNYVMWLPEESIDQSAAWAKIAALVTDPAIQESNIFGEISDDGVKSARLTGGYVSDLLNTDTQSFESVDLTQDQARLLEEAVRRDIQAGRFGKTMFITDYKDYLNSVYYFDIQLHYTISREYRDGSVETYPTSVSLKPSVYCTETIKVLEQAGVITGARKAITRSQYQDFRAAQDGGEYWDEYAEYPSDSPYTATA